jgi:energy-coupling factor transporter ATP-binding protein EcfA2
MSSLASTAEQSESQQSDLPRLKTHLQIPRQAYERLIQEGVHEETKKIDSEADDAEEQAQQVCMKWLVKRGLIYTRVDGEGETSFINALLQHATGFYAQETFPEASEILETSIEDLENPARDFLKSTVIEDIVEAVNKSKQTNLLVFILSMTSGFKPAIIGEFGSKFGDPVVIWYRKEGRYSSIIVSETQEDIESDSKSESQDSNPVASITFNYRNELRSLKRHIYDIANPLIAKEILDTLSNIESLSDDEGILPFFSNLPKETFEALGSLSDEISKLMKNHSDKLDELKPRIIEDLKTLSRDVELEVTPWEELKLLLEIPAIRGLPNIDIKKIKHHIYKGNTESLRECLDSLIKIRNLDMNEIKSIISQTDYEDLDTLLAEIIENKPRKKEDLLSFWHCKEDFFINKTFYISIPDQAENLSGLIVDCSRHMHGSFHFKLHDNTRIEVNKYSSQYSISITTEICLPLWTAIKENKLNNKPFEIRMPKSFEEYSSTMIFPGKYRLEKKDRESSLLNSKVKELVYLRDLTHSKRYCIKAIYHDIKSNFPAFEISVLNNYDEVKHFEQMQYMEFQKTYLAVVENERYHSCDPAKHITVRDEIDENQLKMKYLKEIYNDIETLRVEFSREESRNLLDSLLDSLIRNQLKKVDLEILTYSAREDLARKLEKVSNSYKNNLRNERHPEDILKQIVIDANYARIIHKSQGLEVSKAMELLKQAFKYINEIKGKDLILFIGNTGSGKSTTISYLLGADLEYFYNKAGDQVVRVKSESSSSEMPIIGQSLGESETLYTRGYYLPAQYNLPSSVIVTDCPGFRDTRGGHYELCTNLSIDQTIKQCASIKAIVIAVPIQAFQLDRSNPILNLIESVIERFNEVFNADYPEGNRRVFLLLTKSSQAPQGVVEKLKDGSRFQELYSEANSRFRNLYESGKVDKFELEIAERKKKLWQTLVRMHEAKQIDVIDIKNKIQRKKLLEKYSVSSESVNKACYEGLMQSRDMQIKFGKYIEMSTHTWTHLIFKQYLEVLPASIKASQEKIEHNRNRIIELRQAKEAQELRIQELKEKSTMLKEQIEKSKSDLGSLQLPEGNSIELMNQLKTELERLVKEIQEIDMKLGFKITEINDLEDQLRKIYHKIEENSNEIMRLSQGSRIEILYEEDYRGRERDIIKIYQHENNEVQTAFEEIRELEDHGDVTSEQKANCVYGTLVRVKAFEKIYKLVPSNPDLRREFERNLRSVSGDAKYVANIEGEGISDIQCKANGDGKKIAYHFNLNFTCSWYHWLFWLNPTMPWIKITHEIPNIDYNEASIINKNAIINQLRKQKAELELELNGIDGKNNKTNQKQQLEQKLIQLRVKKENLIKEIEQLRSNLDFQYLNKRLNEINNERNTLINSTEIEDEIESINKENASEEEKIVITLKWKKHLAIIIKTQIDTAKLIREFTEIIRGGGGKESMETTDETFKSSLEFIDEFDTNIHRIECEVGQDLAL